MAVKGLMLFQFLLMISTEIQLFRFFCIFSLKIKSFLSQCAPSTEYIGTALHTHTGTSVYIAIIDNKLKCL